MTSTRRFMKSQEKKLSLGLIYWILALIGVAALVSVKVFANVVPMGFEHPIHVHIDENEVGYHPPLYQSDLPDWVVDSQEKEPTGNDGGEGEKPCGYKDG